MAQFIEWFDYKINIFGSQNFSQLRIDVSCNKKVIVLLESSKMTFYKMWVLTL